MDELYKTNAKNGLSEKCIEEMLDVLIEQLKTAKKILLIPPDYTRCYSYSGPIVAYLYKKLIATSEVFVIPALGTHMPMTKEERIKMFGDDIPDSAYLIHRWQSDTIKIGTIPSSFIEKISDGKYNHGIDVETSHYLFDAGFDQIVSVGQVVPHEVVGMANYSKNIFVGLGGRQMINKSHFVSALCGIENALGKVDTPARMIFDYAQEHFLNTLPITWIQTVTTLEDDVLKVHGVYIGPSRKPFEKAAELATDLNIVHVAKRAKKVVTYLNPEELKTTWVGNKGVYRTRMIIADGGELMILAPGVKDFGENKEIDALIRQYGYCDTPNVLKLYRDGKFENQTMAAAHLMQGSSDGRFTITYCTKPEYMSKEEIESVHYQWMDYQSATERYNPQTMKEGWNIMEDGEEVYFVGTPALGLWKVDE